MSIDLNKMPKLGFGLMRLPEKDGVINLDEVCRMADAYLDAGLTYFDTAYVYHGGNSEKIVKDALVKRHPRESFTLATKLPAWCMKEEADRDRIFNEQLERCGVDYFDFYLLHSIEDGSNGDTYDRLNCWEWGEGKEGAGKDPPFRFFLPRKSGISGRAAGSPSGGGVCPDPAELCRLGKPGRLLRQAV